MEEARSTQFSTLRFGGYEVDLVRREIIRNGARLRLQERPFRVLQLLLERRGEVVSREELQRSLWPSDTYVDFNNGLNTAVNRLRQALGDSAEDPRFIETVARRGYRFVGTISTNGGAPEEGPGPVVMAGSAWNHGRLRYGLWVAIALCAALAAGAVLTVQTARKNTSGVIFHHVTFGRNPVLSARFAADGRTIVYSRLDDSGTQQLYLVREDQAEPIPLHMSGAGVVAISAKDEMAIALKRSSAEEPFTLAMAPLTGGEPRQVQANARAADFSPDGSQVAVVRALPGHDEVEFPLGTVLYRSKGWITHLRMSPRGGVLAMVEHLRPGNSAGQLVTISMSGARRVLTSEFEIGGLAWDATGARLWFSAAVPGAAQNLYRVEANGGAPQVMTQAPERLVLQDISRQGKVLLTSGNVSHSVLAAVPGKTRAAEVSVLDSPRIADLSADGRYVLFDDSADADSQLPTIFLRDLRAERPEQMGQGVALALSPNRDWALARLPDPTRLALLPIGPGTAKPVATENHVFTRARWTADGSKIVLIGAAAGERPRLFVLDVPSQKLRQLPLEVQDAALAVSPGGDSAAVLAQDGSLAIVSLASGTAQALPEFQGFVPVAWSSEGRAIFARSGAGVRAQIYRLDLFHRRAELRDQIEPPESAGVTDIDRVLLSADGSVCVYSFTRDSSELFLAGGWN